MKRTALTLTLTLALLVSVVGIGIGAPRLMTANLDPTDFFGVATPGGPDVSKLVIYEPVVIDRFLTASRAAISAWTRRTVPRIPEDKAKLSDVKRTLLGLHQVMWDSLNRDFNEPPTFHRMRMTTEYAVAFSTWDAMNTTYAIIEKYGLHTDASNDAVSVAVRLRATLGVLYWMYGAMEDELNDDRRMADREREARPRAPHSMPIPRDIASWIDTVAHAEELEDAWKRWVVLDPVAELNAARARCIYRQVQVMGVDPKAHTCPDEFKDDLELQALVDGFGNSDVPTAFLATRWYTYAPLVGSDWFEDKLTRSEVEHAWKTRHKQKSLPADFRMWKGPVP